MKLFKQFSHPEEHPLGYETGPSAYVRKLRRPSRIRVKLGWGFGLSYQYYSYPDWFHKVAVRAHNFILLFVHIQILIK